MIHITLAIGLVLGSYLFSIIFKVMYTAGTQLQPTDLYSIKQYAYLSYIPAIILASILVKVISLKSRLPVQLPAKKLLIAGVWLSLLQIVYNSFAVVKMGLAHAMAILHEMDIVSLAEILSILIKGSEYLSTISSALIVCALMVIFLETAPYNKAFKRDAEKASRPLT